MAKSMACFRPMVMMEIICYNNLCFVSPAHTCEPHLGVLVGMSLILMRMLIIGTGSLRVDFPNFGALVLQHTSNDRCNAHDGVLNGVESYKLRSSHSFLGSAFPTSILPKPSCLNLSTTIGSTLLALSLHLTPASPSLPTGTSA